MLESVLIYPDSLCISFRSKESLLFYCSLHSQAHEGFFRQLPHLGPDGTASWVHVVEDDIFMVLHESCPLQSAGHLEQLAVWLPWQFKQVGGLEIWSILLYCAVRLI